MESSPSSNHFYSITGCLSINSMSQKYAKPTVCRQAKLTLGRNLNRKIILCVNLGKGKDLSYLLTDSTTVHHKFANANGKGSICLPNKDLQFLISNSAPNQLNIFLKTLEAKINLQKQPKSNGDSSSPIRTPLAARNRQRFASVEIPIIEEKLSPLTFNEIRKLRPNSVQTNSLKSPKSPKLGVKRRTACSAVGGTPTRKSAAKKPSQESIVYSTEQKEVLRAVASGKNVFFTGSAGTGKSLLLKRIVRSLPPKSTVVTAATGVAACQIGGKTLHHFGGIGSGEGTLTACVQMALRPHISSQWKKCQHLIIDEISMIDADYFTKLDKIGRIVRGKDKPFGGIQLIICGDFLQLPPVSTDQLKKKQYCFQSESWYKSINVSICLKQVRRQNDSKFIQILQDIRNGLCTPEACKILRQTQHRSVEANGVLPTKLCTHKHDARAININNLEALPGKVIEFKSVDSSTLPDAFNDFIAPAKVSLKVGAQVMLTKNLDLSQNLSNGTRGVVESFTKGFPVVRFGTGLTIPIGFQPFPVPIPGESQQITRTQIPLQLAWAISIHKSQGMSLDRVEMSLGKVFENGQAYVALSRARSLEGLRIFDFHPKCVRSDPAVLEFYRELNEEIEGVHDHTAFGSPQLLIKRQRLTHHFS